MSEDTATFYLYNLSGQIVGYQQYRPKGEKKPQNNPKEGKYFTYAHQPTVTVFGVETLKFPGPVFITEGIFDACRLTYYNRPTLAILSNNNPGVTNFLYILNRPTVAICDNDDAGKKLAKFGTYKETVQGCHDLGDAPQKYIDYLLHKYRN